MDLVIKNTLDKKGFIENNKKLNFKIVKLFLTFLLIFILIFEFNAKENVEVYNDMKVENEFINKNKSIILLSFEGKKLDQSNELKWKIASDFNVDFFTIEKSIDGHFFEVVGTQKCGENSNQVLEYELIDGNVKSEINYYRVKQTNYDGSFDYSEMISIDNSKERSFKEINKIVNLLGQEVSELYRGIVVVEYSDGTLVKVIQ